MQAITPPPRSPTTPEDRRDLHPKAAVAAGADQGDGRMALVFLAQGIAMLFPWNALISAPAFFASKLAGTPYHTTFLNYFSVVYLGSNLVGMVLTLYFTPASPRADRRWTAVAFLVECAIFVLLLISALMESVRGEAFFMAVLVAVSICGIAVAVMTSGLFALAGRSGVARYTSMMLIGQGLAGITICLLQLILDLTGVATALAAAIYFSAALVTLGSCFLAFLPMHAKLSSTSKDDEDERVADLESPTELLLPVMPLPAILRLIGPYVAAVALVFASTLALFPSFTLLLSPTQGQAPSKAFTSASFLAFNVGDTLGRSATTLLPSLPSGTGATLGFALARTIVLVPLFLVMPLSVAKNPAIPTLSDVPGWIIVLLPTILAATGGGMAAVTFKGAPERVYGAAERALVGRVMTFGMLAGLAIGSGCGFGVVAFATAA